MPLTRGVGSTKQNTRKNKAVKRGFVIVSHKLIEIHNNKPLATPQISKRSLLMSGGNDENNNANEKKPVLQQYTFQNSNHTQKKEKVQKSKPNKIQPKMQNFMMTPSQNLVHSRKLLQMKTVGVSNQITDSKVKEEDDIKNMKPSSEFFCKLDYVNQLKEDKHGINTWEKSFGDAINEVNIQNKEYLECIDRTIQRRFAKTPGLCKKTVVFGLDGVLVKTNFEKDKEDWKPATLILNENTGSKITIYVSIRPFVINTLRQLKRAGIELVLYSSSQYNYTSAILDILIKQKIEFHHIICSEDHDKILNPDGKLSKRTVITKNINILLHNRNEKDIIFVDCKVQGFAYSITNGIFVPPYEGPPNDKNPVCDNYFVYLFEYLKDLNGVHDVRSKIEKDFDIKNLFRKNFKNPAMDKIKSLQEAENQPKPTEKCSTPKIETSFRRKSRMMTSAADFSMFQKLSSEIGMEPIKEEFPEKVI